MSLNLLVSSASKALRKPLTMSGWTRPELPSGKGRSVQNYPHSPPEGEVGKSTEPKARLKKALKNREKNSPINLHLSQSSNSPSKCIETFHLLGRLRYYSIREDQNGTGGDRYLDHTPYASPTTTRPRQHLPSRLFWMTIVAEHSIGRVWQEEGERNGVASWSRRGTDPAQLA
uniref:Uncharacterized protein n=1 Tax=Heterorhabditis bacteriophora TaxID=37862 RepID=A0A1I7W781_HETBA